jgi:hypothetical protein
MAKKPKEKADKVIQGDDHGKDVVEQTKEARGIEDGPATVDPGSAMPKKAEPPLTPEMAARDAQIKEREDYLRGNGVDPDQDRNNPNARLKKVEKADVGKKMYRGMVTCTSVHAGTHEKISARIDLPEAVGEERVWLDFKAHHANAMREHFVIDASNTDDPSLRSRYE